MPEPLSSQPEKSRNEIKPRKNRITQIAPPEILQSEPEKSGGNPRQSIESAEQEKPFHFEDQDIEKIDQRNYEYQRARKMRESLGVAPEPETTASEQAYLDQAERGIKRERKDLNFPIGTAVDFDMLLIDREDLIRRYPEREQEIDAYLKNFNDKYKENYVAALENNFNSAVAENTFKWEAMEKTGGKMDYSRTDRVMEFLKSRPELFENFRGHNIFWNRVEHLPENLKGKSKEEIKREIIERRLDILRRYPQIKEWDLLNEPLQREPRLDKNGVDQNEVVFNPEEDLNFFVDLFKQAKAIAPDTKLYVNEYSILSGGQTGNYVRFLQKLIEAGAPIDGIGVQGHITEYDFASVSQMKQNLDDLSKLGLPIKITEFDVSDEVIRKMYFPQKLAGINSEQIEKARADYMRKAMTIFYGTPRVNGIYLWGFQDKSHWRGKEGEHAGLFDDNFQPNQVGQAFQNLTHEQWGINAEVKDEAGQIEE